VLHKKPVLINLPRTKLKQINSALYTCPDNKFYHDYLNQTRQNDKTEHAQRQTIAAGPTDK